MAPKTSAVPPVGAGVCEEIKSKFGKVSVSLSRSELSDAAVAFAAGRECLDMKCATFLEEYGAGPILMQFTQDSTPVKFRDMVTKRSRDCKIKRSSKESHDLMVQSVFLTAPGLSGSYRHCVNYGAPTIIQQGKTKEAMSAIAEIEPGLFSMESSVDAFRLRHQVYDRAVPAAVVDFVSGSWMVKCCGEGAAEDEEEGPEELYELHTWVGCSAHDGHNALRWSQHAGFTDAELLQNIFVGCAALRAGFYKCFSSLEAWIMKVLQPQPRDRCHDSDVLRQ
eukprot:5271776-Amphidinium_carterae.1